MTMESAKRLFIAVPCARIHQSEAEAISHVIKEEKRFLIAVPSPRSNHPYGKAIRPVIKDVKRLLIAARCDEIKHESGCRFVAPYRRLPWATKTIVHCGVMSLESWRSSKDSRPSSIFTVLIKNCETTEYAKNLSRSSLWTKE